MRFSGTRYHVSDVASGLHILVMYLALHHKWVGNSKSWTIFSFGIAFVLLVHGDLRKEYIWNFHVPSKCHPIPSSGLFLFRTLILGQIVLLQQRRNLVRAPQSVIDLAILGLADGCKFN